MISYVAGLMFNADGAELALILKNRPEWQAGYLNAIGGKIEDQETPAQAMQREFREETGVDYAEWTPLVHLRREGAYEVYFFSCFTDDVFKVETQEDEDIDVYPLSELFEYESDGLIPNLKWLIPLARDKNIRSGKFIYVEDVS